MICVKFVFQIFFGVSWNVVFHFVSIPYNYVFDQI
jgi:hypothetical protein